MPISELQREVATIALRAAARNGFALAGGNALIAHGIIDRPTDDVVMWAVGGVHAGVVSGGNSVEYRSAARAAVTLAKAEFEVG